MFIQATAMMCSLKQNRRSVKQGRLTLPACLLALLNLLASSLYAQNEHYIRGRAALQLGKHGKATACLQTAALQDPANADIAYYLGMALYADRDYAAACDAFLTAEKLRPGCACLQLARTETLLHHQERALYYLRLHLESKYRLAESDILLDPVLSGLEKETGWQQLWQEKEWYSEQDKMLGEARFLLERGEIPDAMNLLNALEKTGYRSAEAGFERGRVYARMHNPKAARKAFQEALKKDPKHIPTLEALAELEMAENEAGLAIPLWNRLLRQDPAFFPAYLRRAVSFSKDGKLRAAIGDLDFFLSCFPESDSVLYLKGKIYSEHGKHLDALKALNKALELSQNNAAYFLERGKAYAATGTHRYAYRDFAMALDLDPENGETWYEKGKVAEKLGDNDEACHAYRMAFSQGIHEAKELAGKLCKTP